MHACGMLGNGHARSYKRTLIIYTSSKIINEFTLTRRQSSESDLRNSVPNSSPSVIQTIARFRQLSVWFDTPRPVLTLLSGRSSASDQSPSAEIWWCPAGRQTADLTGRPAGVIAGHVDGVLPQVTAADPRRVVETRSPGEAATQARRCRGRGSGQTRPCRGRVRCGAVSRGRGRGRVMGQVLD